MPKIEISNPYLLKKTALDSLLDGGRYQWGLEEDISLTIIRDFPTGGRIMAAATSKSLRAERWHLQLLSNSAN